MSESLLDDLLSGFDRPPALHIAAPTAAKTAKTAKTDHSSEVAADLAAANGCEGPRKAANGPADPEPDSQEFAEFRSSSQIKDRPDSKHSCGSSQNSLDSQGCRAQCAEPRTCTDCRNRLAPGTCGEPVAAGLAPKYMLIWPPTGHAKACPAFAEKLTSEAPDRPYRLSSEQGHDAHAWPWDDAVIARFQARAHRFTRLGIGAIDAEDLAERLHLRDLEGDERAICLECGHLAGRRCGNYRAAGLAVPDLPASVTVTLQRCHGFTNERTQ